ncbi:MAG: hypothetical protein ABIH76_06500 [Candidatus Bathyarchaeota archaeon]
MIGQTAAAGTLFDKTESLFRDTLGDLVSQQSYLYQEIADDFSVSQRHKAYLVDTISEGADIKGIFPDKLPQPREVRYSFSVLQEWEGYVVSISNETFTARLADVTKNCMIEDEEADFPLDDLEDTDRSIICPGSIFRWIIGYRRSPGGTKDRASRIVLRNLPSWTKKEIEKNQHDAAEWASKLNGE